MFHLNGLTLTTLHQRLDLWLVPYGPVSHKLTYKRLERLTPFHVYLNSLLFSPLTVYGRVFVVMGRHSSTVKGLLSSAIRPSLESRYVMIRRLFCDVGLNHLQQN